jgi:hypothetical protein
MSILLGVALPTSAFARQGPAQRASPAPVPTAQQAYATALAQSLFRPQVAKVVVAPPPLKWGARVDRWLYIDVKGRNRFDLVRAAWQADLLTGALHDATVAQGWTRLVGESQFWIRPGRRRTELERSALGASWGDVDDISRSEVVKAADNFAASDHLRTRSVVTRRLHGGGTVVEIVYRTTQPGKVLRAGSAQMWDLVRAFGRQGERPRIEGIFVEMRVPDGRWVFRFGYSFRSSTTNSVGSPAFAT